MSFFTDYLKGLGDKNAKTENGESFYSLIGVRFIRWNASELANYCWNLNTKDKHK